MMLLCSAGKDLHVVLEDDEVQAISVSTPSATHETFCIQSLRASKAVFCEKPVARNGREGSPLLPRSGKSRETTLLCISEKI